MKSVREVYVIKCNINGKRYVGSTSKGVENRYMQHIRLLKNHKHIVDALQRDFDMYGSSEFNVSLFGTFEEQNAFHIEHLLQYLYESKDKEKGYNYLDKSGEDEKESIINEIEELKELSFLLGVTVECLIKKDYELVFTKNISVDFEKIKEYAKRNSISVSELEGELGFSHNLINRWKKTMARADNLYIVAKYFGTTMEDLMLIR